MLQLEKEFLLQNIAYDVHVCDIPLLVDPVLEILSYSYELRITAVL